MNGIWVHWDKKEEVIVGEPKKTGFSSLPFSLLQDRTLRTENCMSAFIIPRVLTLVFLLWNRIQKRPITGLGILWIPDRASVNHARMLALLASKSTRLTRAFEKLKSIVHSGDNALGLMFKVLFVIPSSARLGDVEFAITWLGTSHSDRTTRSCVKKSWVAGFQNSSRKVPSLLNFCARNSALFEQPWMFSRVFRNLVTFYSATTSSVQDQPYIRDRVGFSFPRPERPDSTVSCVGVELWGWPTITNQLGIVEQAFSGRKER